MPSASRDLGQSNAVDVESSVAEVTEEHLVLVLRFVATDTLLAVSALPLIAGDELGEQQLVIGPTSEEADIYVDQVQTEADTRGVGGLIALAAVEQHLGHANLVLVHVSCTKQHNKHIIGIRTISGIALQKNI